VALVLQEIWYRLRNLIARDEPGWKLNDRHFRKRKKKTDEELLKLTTE